MEWEIVFSRQAEKFLLRHKLSDDFIVTIFRRVIEKIQGEAASVDIKKLSGSWAGHYRVRSGDLRVIFTLRFDTKKVFVAAVDQRGSVY